MPKLRALTEEPPLARGDAEDQVAELRDYLLKIVEELGYLLTHLEADNINDSTFQRISAMIPKAFNGLPLMDGEASPGQSPQWVRGDHVHPTDVSRAAESDLAAHVGNTANPHGVTAAQVGLGNVANERQYSANNPPPYPVTSVNGETGAVVLDASDVGARPDTWTPSAADVGARPDTWVPDAEDVPYDNTGSGLTATNVQDAIDEVYGDIPVQASDIGAQNTITANGILKGDGAGGVSAATPGTDYGTYSKPSGGIPASDLANGVIPTVPSAYTGNPAMDGTASPGSSGAWARGDHVHPSDTSRVPVYGLGKNLLDNAYFVGGGSQLGDGVFPINQRGAATGTTPNNLYFIDRWRMTYGTAVGTWSLVSAGISLTPGTNGEIRLIQVPKYWSAMAGKKATLSVLTSDGKLRYGTATKPSSGAVYFFSDSGVVGNCVGTDIRIQTTVACTIIAVKLELGTEQTLCHNEGTDADPVWVLNEIPDYEAELIKCKTSTADPNDTYANKTLATEQQIAVTQVGPKANRAYAANSYFCWNGLLYRVTAAISSGADLTINTNCVQTTVMDEIIRLT